MILGLLIASAGASSLASLGIPNSGGSFAGPTQDGIYSLTYTPTGALSRTGAVLLDTAVIRSKFTIQLDGDEPTPMGGVSPLPSLSAAYPIHERIGIGLQTGLPYARIGSGDPKGPFRMWTIDGIYALYENRLSVAIQPHERWTVGVGVRQGNSILDSHIAIDTGALMYQLYGSPADELIGDPLLEGTPKHHRWERIGLGLHAGHTVRAH